MTHQISLFAGFHTLSNLFTKRLKTTYSTTLKNFFTVFQISLYFVSTTHNQSILDGLENYYFLGEAKVNNSSQTAFIKAYEVIIVSENIIL